MNDLSFHGSDRTAMPVAPARPLHDATALTEGGNLARTRSMGRSTPCASPAPAS